MHRQDESGRSMIEILGVIAIMGVIMYGAVAGIGMSIEMYKINEAHTEIDELSKAIVNMGDFLGGYSFLNNNSSTLLCNNDAFPICQGTKNGKVWTEAHMIGQWGGEVTVQYLTQCNNLACSSFQITYGGISRGSCERILEDMLFEYVCPVVIECADSNDMQFKLCGHRNQGGGN